MVFGEDPAKYLQEMDARLKDPVNPRANARLDPEALEWVNHEAFFFSEPRTQKKFQKDPHKYCGTITDPVTLERFEPNKKSPAAKWNGRQYYFTSTMTRGAFLSEPERYWQPKNRMRGMRTVRWDPTPLLAGVRIVEPR